MYKELKLKTYRKTQITRIQFGRNEIFEKKIPLLLEKEERKCALIVDSNIEQIYAPFLEKMDLKVFSFPAGEPYKTREIKSLLEDYLLSHKFGRDSLLLGMGGGVVNDLSGFLASTYCRGVGHIQIPTSLLAMVDAAIGGKTAVNTLYGKNMIGTFYPPEEVWIDSEFLNTLPKKDWISGIVEILKAALISSPSLFQSMKENVSRWESRDFPFIMDKIFESISIKIKIVENDPEEERGIRRILNLGHTFGHVIERMENYQIPHGEAVAIGILVEAFISTQLGLLSSKNFGEIQEVFQLYKIPLHLNKPLSIDEVMATLALDKKAVKASPRMVLLQGIGDVASFEGEYCTEIEFPLLEQAVTWMHEKFIH